MPVLTTGDPNNLLTYTAPSTKWVRNSAGVYVSGTTLRCDHLADGTALGLLIEGQFTNVLLRSQEFDNAAWSKTDITVTANATTAPDGTMTADLLTEGTAGTANLNQVGTATTASAAVCGSFFVKPSANNNWVRIIFRNAAGTDGLTAYFNISNGTIGTVSTAGSATSTGGQIVQAANGFWRLEVWATFPAGSSNLQLQLRSATADGNGTAINNAAYYVWQASAGLGARPSSPVVTTTAAVTRAADNISIALSALPFNATKGTLLAKFIVPAVSGNQYVAALTNGATSERIAIASLSGTTQGLVIASSSTVAQVTSGTLSANTIAKGALSWALNDVAFAKDGSLGDPGITAALAAPTQLNIGGRNGGSDSLYGWLQQLIYLPRDMSDAELVSWSTP